MNWMKHVPMQIDHAALRWDEGGPTRHTGHGSGALAQILAAAISEEVARIFPGLPFRYEYGYHEPSLSSWVHLTNGCDYLFTVPDAELAMAIRLSNHEWRGWVQERCVLPTIVPYGC